MKVSVRNGQILTDLFKKPTAVNQYLLPSSCHPFHITNNIPFSLAYRILRICSSNDDFKHHLESLRQDLIARNYHPKVIEDAFEKVCKISRKEALKKVERKKNDREVLAVTFHPALPSITKVVRKHWEVMVDRSNRMKRCFTKPSLVAYRRPKNLGEILIRAKLPNRKSARKKNGFTHCSRACLACIQCDKATTHTDHKTGKTWQISAPLNCESTNVIYKIGCKKCPLWGPYGGETERKFSERLADHRGYVRRKVDTPVGEHFNLPGHNITDILSLSTRRQKKHLQMAVN